ncbi:twin-arginine translocation signal domain-containing protein [Natronobiforma cellulositropha]|uniref:twin-arginine translocation signal domain-containing protein n=1 Tax=Natronobiforma cellulositropha TaxID=1679076 RepID=UPI0021D598F1|nr:twin-arginine translocation signal domain-containing protein [Natronobiforma cellulositropha]
MVANRQSRRRVLKGAGVTLAAVAIAGCGGPGEEEDTAEEDAEGVEEDVEEDAETGEEDVEDAGEDVEEDAEEGEQDVEEDV